MMIFDALNDANLTIKRAAKVGSVVGDPITHITDLKCMMPMPSGVGRASALQEAQIVNTLTRVYETYLNGHHDIEPGDHAVIDGREYVIRAAAKWDNRAILPTTPITHLTLEELIT